MSIHNISLSDTDLAAIRASLGSEIRPNRADLLGPVLCEWLARGFPEYAGLVPAKVSTGKRLVALSKAANKLLASFKALDQADEAGLPVIALKLAHEDPAIRFTTARERVAAIRAELEWMSVGASVWAEKYKKPRKHFVAPVLAVRDIAVIFAWATGNAPTFFVDPDTGKMMGAFFHFAETIWPHLEFKVPNASLVEAIRKWSTLSENDRLSEVIINMALRHREWGPF